MEEVKKDIEELKELINIIRVYTPKYVSKLKEVNELLKKHEKEGNLYTEESLMDIYDLWEALELPKIEMVLHVRDIANALTYLMKLSGFSGGSREQEFRQNMKKGKGVNKTSKENYLTPTQYIRIVDSIREMITKDLIYKQSGIDYILTIWKRLGLPEIQLVKNKTVEKKPNTGNPLEDLGITPPTNEVQKKLLISDINAVKALADRDLRFVEPTSTEDDGTGDYSKTTADSIKYYLDKLSKLTGKKAVLE